MSSGRVLRAHGLAPKKSFGQNFLDDPRLCARIAALATTPEGGTVVEIGAGLGALTEPLSARAARVIAVERDRDLVPLLKERFSADERVRIVEGDAATEDWEAALAGGPRPHAVIGNLPYQITGRLIQRAVGLAAGIDTAVFMVQREVATRLAAAPGDGSYGVLSVFTQAAFRVRVAIKVPAGAFHPVPKVDSAVVLLEPRRPPAATEDHDFRRVVKSAFAQRRKKLRNNWKALGDRESVAAAADAAGVDLDDRAEVLSVDDFARMSDAWRRIDPTR